MPDAQLPDARISDTQRPEVEIVQLDLATLSALARGDLAAAVETSPAPLSPYLADEECRGTWARRVTQLRSTPEDASWVTGVVVAGGVAVGRAGFHAAPDAVGEVEVGYAIDPSYRRRGFARAALGALLDRARSEPSVTRVLASVGPWNDASLAMVRAAGFRRVGEQIDDEDGLEWVFALDVSDGAEAGTADSDRLSS